MLKPWIKPVELDPRIGGGELPVDCRRLGAALDIPGVEFSPQAWFVGNASIEALARKDARFDFRDVEPTAVARGVDDLKPRRQIMGLWSREGRVERGDVVGVEVVVVLRQRVGVEDDFHLRDEPGQVALGNAEPLGPPGLQLVFLSVLRTVSRPMLTTLRRRCSA